MARQKRTRTTMKEYPNVRQARKGVRSMERKGWVVSEIKEVGQGYSAVKTIALGIIFLPAALLGKKRNKYQVTYTR